MLGMVLKDGRKMSKSAGDAGDPQHLLDKYGADAVRTAMNVRRAPDQSFEWSEAGVEGQGRFCKRLWNMVHEHVAAGGCRTSIAPRSARPRARCAARPTRPAARRRRLRPAACSSTRWSRPGSRTGECDRPLRADRHRRPRRRS